MKKILFIIALFFAFFAFGQKNEFNLIKLDSTDKNAYFLRGIAYYSLDKKQKGCDDFQKSIDLGFEILKEAEYNKCKDFWYD